MDQLPSMAGDLPPGARAFATDTDHYDFHNKRCVKDLEFQTIRSVGADDDEIEIQFRHNCWKHDEDLVIHYTGVSSFITETLEGDQGTGLATVILDEILPHENGCSHEIAFWNGTLSVVCRDLVAAWTEVDCSTKP